MLGRYPVGRGQALKVFAALEGLFCLQFFARSSSPFTVASSRFRKSKTGALSHLQCRFLLNSFALTVIFSPPRVISILEKSTSTSAKTYTASGLTRDARLISARKRAPSSLGAERHGHVIVVPPFPVEGPCLQHLSSR